MMTLLHIGKKKCNICETHKDAADFYKWNKTKDGLMSRCKECHRQRQKEYRHNPENNYNKLNRDLRLRKKLKAISLFGNQCADCKTRFHHAVYDFHHLDPSQKEISIGELLHKSWKYIEKELLKCVMLCANCHRLRHAYDTTGRESERETIATVSS